MTVKNTGAPISTARAHVKSAGDALVEKKLVSKKQMERIFGNTTLTQDERRIARKLVRHAQTEVERQGLGRAGTRAVKEFAGAVDVENKIAQRIEDARTALKAGAIDEDLFHALTAEKPGLRTRIKLWAAAKHAHLLEPSAQRAMERLSSSLSSKALQVVSSEKAWGLATFAAIIATGILVPGAGAGLLLAESFAGLIAGGAASTALQDVPRG